MEHRSTPMMGASRDLDDEGFDRWQQEVADEAMSMHHSLEESGGWRSPQDLWVEAHRIVLARHRA